MTEPAETTKKWLTAMNEHDVDLMRWQARNKMRRITEYYDGAAVASQMGLS